MDEIDAIFKERFKNAAEQPLPSGTEAEHACTDDEDLKVEVTVVGESAAESAGESEVRDHPAGLERVSPERPTDGGESEPVPVGRSSAPASIVPNLPIRRWKLLGAFALIWLPVGFAGGTATLMGPVRWITRFGRERGWSANLESNLALLAIALFVLGSAALALWITRNTLRSPRLHVRAGLPILAVASAAACLWLWMSPELMGAGSARFNVGSSFSFGSFATEARMSELKAEGFTAVVSLLHPAVVPFETKLIADGKAAAERVGLDYIHLPMLPWVSDNTQSLERLERLVQNGGGRYYVHCYLGKDRIRVAKRVVEETDPSADTTATAELTEHSARRKISGVERFERGSIIEIDSGVFLTPYPTESELVSYFLAESDLTVVSLMDPNHSDDAPWIEKERELLEGNRKPLNLLPLSTSPFDPHATLEAARQVARMPRPLVVHAFLAADSGRSPTAEGFLQAFRSDLPPLPPSLFGAAMSAGEVRVIAPNVALGPRPRGPEFGSSLARRGVREFIYVGAADDPAAVEDATICADAGLKWRIAPAGGELRSMLADGGPWYVYGPGAARQESMLAESLGPVLPDHMLWNPNPASSRIATTLWEFVQRVRPDIKTIILLGPLFLVLGAAAAWFAGWLRQVRDVRAPYTRKVFHFIIFTVAGLLHLTGGLPVVSLFGGIISLIVLYGVFRGDGFGFYEALARPTDAPRRSLFILVPLVTTALGGLTSNLLFGAMATIGYLVVGWGDAVAEPVGTRWGRHRYSVPSLAGVPATRSLEGSAAVLVVGTIAAVLGLTLAGVAAPAALGVGLACGFVGALVEAMSNHGLDNLTVQIAAAGVAYLFLA